MALQMPVSIKAIKTDECAGERKANGPNSHETCGMLIIVILLVPSLAAKNLSVLILFPLPGGIFVIRKIE